MWWLLALVPALLVAFLLIRAARFPSRQITAGAADPIQLDEEALAERLAQALRFRTVSYQDWESFEGEPFLALHEYLESSFPRVHGSLTREVVADYSLFYTWRGREEGAKPYLLMSHLDVVPVEPGTEGNWTWPPFEGRIAEGFVWGRGAMDVKCGVLGILEAVEMLLEQGFQPRRTVYLAFGHDEEVGGSMGAAKIAGLLRSRGVELEYVLDEGGGVGQGLLASIPVPVAMVGIGEKGNLSLEFSVEGMEGHSAIPPKHTAIGLLSTAVHRLERRPLPASLVGPTRQTFAYTGPELPFLLKLVMANLWLFGPLVKRQMARSPTQNAIIRTTTAPTIFEAGVKENVLPSKARVVVNFRILPGDSVASVTEHVRRAIGDPRIKVEPLSTMKKEPSPVSPTDSAGFERLQRTIAQFFPGAVVAPYLVIGGTDARHYAGISEGVYRFSPLELEPADLGRIHGTDERISVTDYARSVRFFVQFIRDSDAEPR
jgi:carboxypeptidase PM20D1